MEKAKRFKDFTFQMFSLLVLIYCTASYLDHSMIAIREIYLLFGMACATGGLTILRMILDEKQFMVRLSYSVKRLIYAPFYLAVTLATLLQFGEPFENDREDAIIIVVSFAITFIVTGFIRNRILKKRLQADMKKVQQYQKGLEE